MLPNGGFFSIKCIYLYILTELPPPYGIFFIYLQRKNENAKFKKAKNSKLQVK